MKPDVVVDVGNSRIKWGRDYSTARVNVINSVRRLNFDDPDGWTHAAHEWSLKSGTHWVVSGVNPDQEARFNSWCRDRGDEVVTIDRHDQIPIAVEVDHPQRVGLDRLFGAVAAANYYPGAACVVIDIGTAMTVNFVLPPKRFVGGAILPGPQLMAKVLNDYTAKLPLIRPHPVGTAEYSGKNTDAAINCGINAAICGAAHQLIERFAADHPGSVQVYWTGGDMGFLGGWHLPGLEIVHVPVESLTLTGIWIAAESLP